MMPRSWGSLVSAFLVTFWCFAGVNTVAGGRKGQGGLELLLVLKSSITKETHQ